MPILEMPGPDDPLPENLLPPSADCEISDTYEYVDVSHMPRVPLFRVQHSKRGESQTDEQDRVSRRMTEEYYKVLSILRFLAHFYATALGYHKSCQQPACRRARRCVTDRLEYDWTFPGPWMPPCANTPRLVEAVREQTRAFFKSNDDDTPVK